MPQLRPFHRGLPLTSPYRQLWGREMVGQAACLHTCSQQPQPYIYIAAQQQQQQQQQQAAMHSCTARHHKATALVHSHEAHGHDPLHNRRHVHHPGGQAERVCRLSMQLKS